VTDRWQDPTAERPPEHRRALFEEYVANPGLPRLGISYGQYVELREAGRWNEYADARLGGRFRVDEITTDEEG
jgi:hypothetical protein